MPPRQIRPSLFVGSSSESLPQTQAVQLLLDPVCQVELWTQGVFGLTHGTLESLVLALPRFDFAVLVLGSEDLLVSRGEARQVARDNVLFELGLFVGALGRERTFMIYDRSNPPALPSDLAGVTAATYQPFTTGDFRAALGASCTLIQNAIEKIGVRESQGYKKLVEATESVEDVSGTVATLVRLLARSRKVELDILIEQFSGLIDPAKLKQIEADLEELAVSLEGR